MSRLDAARWAGILWGGVVLVAAQALTSQATAGERIIDGAALLAVCTAEQRSINRICDEVVMQPVFDVIVREPSSNPFYACPLELSPVEAFQERLDGLRAAVSDWLVNRPEVLESKNVDALVYQAIVEMPVCDYQ